MKFRFGPDPDKSVHSISDSLEEIRSLNEGTEALRAKRQEVFDAVSECLWVFRDGRCVLRNLSAEQAEQRAGSGMETIRHSILESGLKLEYGFPDLLRFPESGLVLGLRSAKRLNLESGPGILIAATDLSGAMEMGERIRERKYQEQRRIARDLHDGLSQALASLAFQLQALSLRNAGPEIDRLAALAEQALEDAAELHLRYAKNAESKGDSPIPGSAQTG